MTTAYNEKKVLVKEMDALNEMFANMETKYITEAAEGCQEAEASTDSLVEDAAAQTRCGPSPTASVLEDSCFKEVKTKNGTRMVLSVSKTYMKLRDLIVEKKTLEEQVLPYINIARIYWKPFSFSRCNYLESVFKTLPVARKRFL